PVRTGARARSRASGGAAERRALPAGALRSRRGGARFSRAPQAFTARGGGAHRPCAGGGAAGPEARGAAISRPGARARAHESRGAGAEERSLRKDAALGVGLFDALEADGVGGGAEVHLALARVVL